MKTKFLIIGVAGALGSGCSEIAKFIANDLEGYKEKFKVNHMAQLDTYISKYYRHLKSMGNSFTKQVAELTKENEKLFIGPEELQQNASEFRKLNLESEPLMKDINRKLRNYLFVKKIMRYFCEKEWPAFTYVSMSNVIMKIVIEKSITDQGIESDEIREYDNSDILPGARDKIVKLAQKHMACLVKFNKVIESNEYTHLDNEFCSCVDQFFIDATELKEELISKKEVGDQWLQNMGDNIRGTGNPFTPYVKGSFHHLEYVSFEANKIIKYHRRRKDRKGSNYFIIESFMNPAEVLFFRKRYGSFYLCSVYASKKSRRQRLKDHFVEERDRRDQGIDNKTQDLHKQNVPDCVLMADYALNNEPDEKFKRKIARLLVLIDCPGTVYPTADEVFMNLAYSLSLRSTCISRQVGAVITNKDAFVIAAGWNDVGSGQLGCSLNCKNDYVKYSDDEYLLSVWREKFEQFKKNKQLASVEDDEFFCFKDMQSQYLVSTKIDNICNNFIKNANIPDAGCEYELLEKFKQYLKERLSVKRLEFARALHAEENAILQAARYGGVGIYGGTIYTTTFPCELCAKKIYQSHLNRIVYTEPYPDSISENIFLKDGVRQIQIDQFEGVKSSSFFKLFKPPFNIKEYQLVETLTDDQW